ncbi:hypothetical protein HWV62_35322 [Athelia sp. TMB]|nr:hypothetical protein HWV62_35322 [Athelia sp. TMB]
MTDKTLPDDPPVSSNDNDSEAPLNPFDPDFTEPDADIILQSSDGLRYRLSSYTLRTTSGFFRGMLTLPQGSPRTRSEAEEVIVLDEHSSLIGVMLRMIAGLDFVQWGTLGEAEEMLGIADKYDMPGPMAIIRTSLCMPDNLKEPLKVYAIAARFGWEREAKTASALTLNLSIHDEDHSAILLGIPPTYLLKLFRLHHTRRETFLELSKPSGNPFELGELTPCTRCGCLSLRVIALSHLLNAMVVALERDLSGSALMSGEWKSWPEARESACTRKGCGTYVSHYYPTILPTITATIQSLPSTI